MNGETSLYNVTTNSLPLREYTIFQVYAPRTHKKLLAFSSLTGSSQVNHVEKMHTKWPRSQAYPIFCSLVCVQYSTPRRNKKRGRTGNEATHKAHRKLHINDACTTGIHTTNV